MPMLEDYDDYEADLSPNDYNLKIAQAAKKYLPEETAKGLAKIIRAINKIDPQIERARIAAALLEIIEEVQHAVAANIDSRPTKERCAEMFVNNVCAATGAEQKKEIKRVIIDKL